MKLRVQLGLLLAVLAVVYGNSLLNSFTMDDELYIFRNPQVTDLSVRELFQANKISNVFRPVTFATFQFNWATSGEKPFGYHLFNLSLHMAVALLLFFVLRTLFNGEPRGYIIAFAAALLFAVHPIHTEAVTSIVGRSELLAAGFLLAAWLLHLRDRWLLALLCFVLAVLSKESAVGFLPLALAGDYARRKFKPSYRYIAFGAVSLIYVAALWKIQGGHFGTAFISELDNPLAQLPARLRILNAIRVGWKYMGLQIFPATLSCDYSFNGIPLYGDLRHTFPAALAAAAVFAGWCVALAKRHVGFTVAGAIYFAAFAATSNILTRTGTIMGERLAYLPSAGFCLLLAVLWNWLAARQRTAAIALLAVVATAFAARTAVRNRDWRDNATLYAAAVRAVPGSSKVHFLRGNAYLAENQFEPARSEYQRAVDIYPDFPDVIEALGLLDSRTGHPAAAAANFEKALQMTDRKNIEYDYMAVNLAAALLQTGRASEALILLDREISESPNYARAWSNRSVVHLQRGEVAAARTDAESALRLDPQNSQALGVLNKLNSVAPFSRIP